VAILFGSAHAGAPAALAFDDIVALLHQALAFAILAFLLLLDVGTFFIGHDVLPAMFVPNHHDPAAHRSL
jgi:hypothetical protein